MRNKFFIHGLIVIAVVLFIYSFSYSQGVKETPGKEPPKGEIQADSNAYIIGPEDILYVHIWREEAITRTVPVRMDGNISLPLIDEVKAAGLTPLQLKEILIEKLKKFVDTPNVSVTVMEANSYKVYVSGQVRTPGVYRLRSETSILQIIPMAGGFTEWADQKKILILRKEGGKENRIIVNYKRIVQGTGPAGNIVLKAGDTIIVP